MRFTRDNIKKIQLYIKEHIEKISGKTTLPVDREISYDMIQEHIETLTKYYKESQSDPQLRNLLSKTLLGVITMLQDYLRTVNPWDELIYRDYYIILDALYFNKENITIKNGSAERIIKNADCAAYAPTLSFLHSS